MSLSFIQSLGTTAFVFRGYNQTNLGQTAALLAHPRYGARIERHLRQAEQITADTLRAPVRLVDRVREGRESTLDTFAEDLGLILGVELAHLELLREQHGVDFRQGRVLAGYSLGEVAALVAGGVYRLEDVLPPLVELAGDAADLARDVTMGIVFSRGPALELDAVERLCLRISCEGAGTIAVSSQLAPNSVLVLGQGRTVDRFKQLADAVFAFPPHVRKHAGHWPPLHTPILWQRNISNRAAQRMLSIRGGFQAPYPAVLSLVTGRTSYHDYNSREMLVHWLDHRQRLWEAVCELLTMDIDTLVHVGPEPNLVPATFKRLSDNVSAQLSGRSLDKVGLRAISNLAIAGRSWLTKALAGRVALLRAPFVRHVVLEDWLLEHG